MMKSIITLFILLILSSQIYAQISIQRNQSAYFTFGASISYDVLNFIKETPSKKLIIPYNGSHPFNSFNQKLFFSYKINLAEHLIFFERGYGRKKIVNLFDASINIENTKVGYSYNRNFLSKNAKLVSTFGIGVEFIYGRIANYENGPGQIRWGNERKFNDLGFRFSSQLSYRLKRLSLFYDIHSLFYVNYYIIGIGSNLGIVVPF